MSLGLDGGGDGRDGGVAAGGSGGSGLGGSGLGLLRLLAGAGDAELGGVLELAGHVVDDLDAVAVGAGGGLESRIGSPGELAGVGDGLNNGVLGHDVDGGALEEDEGDLVGGGGGPGDLEGLASGDNLCFVRMRLILLCL